MTPEEKLEEIERIVYGYHESKNFPHSTINKILDVIQAPTTTERH